MISLFPRPIMKFIVDRRIFKVFPYLPLGPLLFAADVVRAIIWRDPDMIAYFRNYRWSIMRRFDPRSPVYWRKKTVAVPDKTFLRVPEPHTSVAAHVSASAGAPLAVGQ